MPKRQAVFTVKDDDLKVEPTEEKLNYKMLKAKAEREKTLKRVWSKTRGVCPYCMYDSTWDEFHQVKIDGSLSAMFKCPYCGSEMRRRTLSKFSTVSLYEFSAWFWLNFYEWNKFRKKTSPHFETLMNRVRDMGIGRVFWKAQKDIKHGRHEKFREVKRFRTEGDTLDDTLEGS